MSPAARPADTPPPDPAAPPSGAALSAAMVPSKAKDALDAGAVTAQKLNAAVNDVPSLAPLAQSTAAIAFLPSGCTETSNTAPSLQATSTPAGDTDSTSPGALPAGNGFGDGWARNTRTRLVRYTNHAASNLVRATTSCTFMVNCTCSSLGEILAAWVGSPCWAVPVPASPGRSTARRFVTNLTISSCSASAEFRNSVTSFWRSFGD